MTPEEQLNELDRRIRLTAKCRFEASQRFESLDWVTLASVVTLSVSVIGLTLIDVFELLEPQAKRLVAAAQIFSSVGVLGYSVFLSRGDFALQKYKYHQAGLALYAIRDRIAIKLLSSPSDQDVQEIQTSYNQVLERFDNHLSLDFDAVKVQSRDLRREYHIRWYNRV